RGVRIQDPLDRSQDDVVERRPMGVRFEDGRNFHLRSIGELQALSESGLIRIHYLSNFVAHGHGHQMWEWVFPITRYEFDSENFKKRSIHGIGLQREALVHRFPINS